MDLVIDSETHRPDSRFSIEAEFGRGDDNEDHNTDDEPNDRDILLENRANSVNTRKVAKSGQSQADERNSQEGHGDRKLHEALILSYFSFSKKIQESIPSPDDNIKGHCLTCNRQISGRSIQQVIG